MKKRCIDSAAPNSGSAGALRVAIWIESWAHPGEATQAVVELRKRQSLGAFDLAKSPDEAEIILFVDAAEIYGGPVHPLYLRLPDRCACYSTGIPAYGLLPGSYTSIAKWRNRFGRYVNYGYVGQPSVHERVPRGSLDFDAPRRYLFSFMGGSTSWVRKRLYKLRPKRADVLIEDTSKFHNWSQSQAENERGRIRYYQTIIQSKFVLCPRGAAPSSIRLYETMELGRVPVIISDAWLPNPLVDWELFAVFVRERDIRKLEKRLSSLESEAEAMGRRARRAWETHFAPDRQFEGLLRCLSLIPKQRRVPERRVRFFWPVMIALTNLRLAVRSSLRSFVLSVFRVCRLRFPYRLNRES